MAQTNKDLFRQIIGLTELEIIGSAVSVSSVQSSALLALQKARGKGGDIRSISVSPLFIDSIGVLLSDTEVIISALIGGSKSHTYMEVKMLECAMSVENGADEIEVFMDSGELIYGEEGIVRGELEIIKEEIDDAVLKAVIETDKIKDNIRIFDIVSNTFDAGVDIITVAEGFSDSQLSAVLSALSEYEGGSEKGVKIECSSKQMLIDSYNMAREILGDDLVNRGVLFFGVNILLFDEICDEI